MKNTDSAMAESSEILSSTSPEALSQVDCFSRIFRTVENCGYTSDTAKALENEIRHVGEIYGIDDESVVILSCIMEKSGLSRTIDDEMISGFLRCTKIEFLRHYERLTAMRRSGIIRVCTGGIRHQNGYMISADVLRSVANDSPFTPAKFSGLSSEEFFSRLKHLLGAVDNNSISLDTFTDEIDDLVKENSSLPFCRRVLDLSLRDKCMNAERRIFFNLCSKYVSFGKVAVDVERLMEMAEFFDEDLLKGKLSRGNLGLMRLGLVEFACEGGVVNDKALSLTDKVRNEFFTDVEIATEPSLMHRDIIKSDSISEQKLFYNPSEEGLITRLQALLQEDNFKKVQERLVGSGMRKGFNIVFHGDPGTGKTATAMQLGRLSGRDVFLVDMAALRSKWVGDSEKSVKGLFRMYRQMCRTAPKAPILLFNEADAIFAKRMESVEHSADQMNNTIQNIILQEMETLEGILIATTNLITNLDPAFGRRFIYKVEFTAPDENTRSRIWRSMVPSLSEEDAFALAEDFPFSGGDIENVVRKSTVEYILSGSTPTLSSLRSLCGEELLKKDSKTRRIGFTGQKSGCIAV